MSEFAAARTLIQMAELPPVAAFAADSIEGGMPTKTRTHLRRSLATLSIDTAAITALHPNIAARIKDYRTSFIADASFGPVEA